MKKRWFSCSIAILMSLAASAQAEPESQPSGWTLEPGRTIGGISRESGARLMDPVIMDFNGDGYDDLIFGAPGVHRNGADDAGSIYIIAGKKDMAFDGQRDVTFWNNFDWRFDGHLSGGRFGMTLYTGDFNGDGFKDLAVSEPGQKGAVYIFYSRKDRPLGIRNAVDKDGADLIFTGSEPGSSLGISGCVGDFNHDGIDDIALSALTKNATYGNNASQVILLPMRRQWDKRAYSVSGKFYGKTVLSRPVSGSTRVVHSCAFGDFNDDNLTDIALGMPFDTYDRQKLTGSVTMIYNPYKYNGTVVDLGKVDDKTGIRINGSQVNAQLGYALASGDFTGDGRDDLAVSAPNRLLKGPKSEGAVYVIEGGKWPKESGAQPDDLMTIAGEGGKFGHRLMTADVNGDKRPDLVVSAPDSGHLSAGSFSVWLGGPHFVESANNKLRADISVSGADFMQFGIGSAFGDLNGDGKIDAAVRTTADPMQRESTGALAVIGAASELPQTSTISDRFMTVAAPSRGGGLGRTHKTAEIAGKKYDAWFSRHGLGARSTICLTEADSTRTGDIVISAPKSCDYQIVGPENYPIADFSFTPTPTLKPMITVSVPGMPVKKSLGVVAAIPLPDEMPQTLVLNLNESTLAKEARAFILKDEADSALGTKIEWHDIDKDGYDDLIIGAPERIIDAEASGTVFIVKGSAEVKNGFFDLNDKKILRYEGFLNEKIGADWQILDFNSDGLLDIAVNAPYAENAAGENYPSVYVIYSAGHRDPKSYNVRAPELASTQIIAAQPYADLNILPQSVDLNGDGYSDLVLIAPDYRFAIQKEGIVYGLYARADRNAAPIELGDTDIPDMIMRANRNERLVDARFVRRGGNLQIITVSSDIMTGTTSSLNAFAPAAPNEFTGIFSSMQLKRTASEVRFPNAARLMLASDPEKKNDRLWVLFPDAGLTVTGQGIAQKILNWTVAEKPKRGRSAE